MLLKNEENGQIIGFMHYKKVLSRIKYASCVCLFLTWIKPANLDILLTITIDVIIIIKPGEHWLSCTVKHVLSGIKMMLHVVKSKLAG